MPIITDRPQIWIPNETHSVVNVTFYSRFFFFSREKEKVPPGMLILLLFENLKSFLIVP